MVGRKNEIIELFNLKNEYGRYNANVTPFLIE